MGRKSHFSIARKWPYIYACTLERSDILKIKNVLVMCTASWRAACAVMLRGVQANVEGVHAYRVSGAEKQNGVKSSFTFEVITCFSSTNM